MNFFNLLYTTINEDSVLKRKNIKLIDYVNSLELELKNLESKGKNKKYFERLKNENSYITRKLN
ncbi:hypothetical protein HERIO_2436 [Hepatospora eriocheir]|uniref:Uncharacterized protein n=1 Tax=Hepatospora eriocheir TaxID=1081669 RepID=A0A1X0Q6Y2_9MICR|nr:hypothetical protein HERIO_2436 [Hepatospora eriocheir]